jgi:hypothetical protein
VRYFRVLGFGGPFPGRRHQHLTRGALRVTIPNPHQGDISASLPVEILRKAGISRDEWEQL